MHDAATRNSLLPFPAYLSQILEVAAVEFRRLTYLPTLDDSARGAPLTVTSSRKKLTAPEIQQMVTMYENENYSQEKLAQRFHCSATTVSRFIRRAQGAE
jgi:DNA-binding MarR family transcriptional regulator